MINDSVFMKKLIGDFRLLRDFCDDLWY